MSWYYASENTRAGPVSEEQFDELIRSGTIQPGTLVWRDGMANWTPYREATRPFAPAADGAVPPIAEGPQAPCSECGKFFPTEEMIRHGTAYVCAGCKPIFLQKLAEGAALKTGELPYASFGIRCVAYFLDVLILQAANLVLSLVAGVGLARAFLTPGTRGHAAIAPAFPITFMAVMVLLAILYEALLVGKFGATPGKMVCRIKVVTADGGRVSYARAFGRYFGKMLSGFTFLIGFIMAAFDGQKRALHDHLCNTRVVYK